MKERKKYIRPKSEVVSLTSRLANNFGGNEGDIGFATTSGDPITADAREQHFFEEENSDYTENPWEK